jgi:hypothetical protein
MPSISHSILIAAVVSILAALTEAPAARGFVDGWEDGYWADTAVSDPIPSKDTWRAYYATHAKVGSGPEKQLANGVRWRLATDRRTGIAMPRIISMPDSKKRDIANQLLETVHGGAMLFARKEQASLRAYAKEYAENGPGWPISKEDYERRRKTLQDMMKEPLVEQTDVALTYASARFVSLIDLGFINKIEGTYLPRIIRGVTLDLERRQIFTMETCPEGSFKRPGAIYNPLFRFADLLDICDQASLEQFEVLVEAVDDRIRVATADSKDPLIEGCRWASIKSEQTFVVYLTIDGLAVHLTVFSPNAASRSCPLTLSVRNPLIVPYRALEPLMKPGPLRDELLK